MQDWPLLVRYLGGNLMNVCRKNFGPAATHTQGSAACRQGNFDPKREWALRGYSYASPGAVTVADQLWQDESALKGHGKCDTSPHLQEIAAWHLRKQISSGHMNELTRCRALQTRPVPRRHWNDTRIYVQDSNWRSLRCRMM